MLFKFKSQLDCIFIDNEVYGKIFLWKFEIGLQIE